MSNTAATVAHVFAAFNGLSKYDKTQFLKLVSPPETWLTLEEVAFLMGKSKAQISRDVKSGKLAYSGEHGHKTLRIATSSIVETMVNDARKRLEAKIRLENLLEHVRQQRAKYEAKECRSRAARQKNEGYIESCKIRELNISEKIKQVLPKKRPGHGSGLSKKSPHMSIQEARIIIDKDYPSLSSEEKSYLVGIMTGEIE